MIRVFIAGWAILIAAIVLNIIALRLGLTAWHVLLEDAAKTNFMEAFLRTNLISKVFLLIIYPLLLSFAAMVIFKK